MWTQKEGIQLCRILEEYAVNYKFHVALTGGLLYKDGERKDCDIILYSHNGENEEVKGDDFKNDLHLIGIELRSEHSRVLKCYWRGKPVDLIFPQFEGEYKPDKT